MKTNINPSLPSYDAGKQAEGFSIMEKNHDTTKGTFSSSLAAETLSTF